MGDRYLRHEPWRVAENYEPIHEITRSGTKEVSGLFRVISWIRLNFKGIG
jgi:hypothetical protein